MPLHPAPPPGTGVHVYVLDTGIRSTHEQFYVLGGSSSGGSSGGSSSSSSGRPPSRVSPESFSAFGRSAEDCHGHGTHVAAVIGGLDFGVAKNVTLHAVQVRAQGLLRRA